MGRGIGGRTPFPTPNNAPPPYTLDAPSTPTSDNNHYVLVVPRVKPL